MGRFLYEKSVAYRGFLIIPFVFSRINNQDIYSYCLLSEQGYKNELHQAENPAGLYSNNLNEIIAIAKTNLESYIDNKVNDSDYFRDRYTYNDNFIVIHQKAGKCFYDHYPPHELRNIAAPKLFHSAIECLTWIKQGLDRHKVS
ncbi:hypothetical protein IQ238_13575 [Pleurocapsales cyanobacterium LEGE 06147]|nr:hypothetical protein [Pleurocapsales cyanobacterium LEGE 06147]